MADRYWVGGTGSWTSTNTANWSASSGGASGASVPTSGDNVFFDVNSNTGTGAFTVTVSGTSRPCLNFTASGLDGVMTFAGTASLQVSGSLSLPATNFSWTNTATLSFFASTSQTITTSGNVITSPITFAGTGGTFTLQDALTCTGSVVTLTNGTLNLNNFSLTAPTFNTSASTARVLAFGTSGILNLSGSGTVWTSATTTNFTYTGTSNIRLTNAGSTATTINAGTLASQAMNFYVTAGTYSLTITQPSTFRILDFTGFSGTYAQGSNITVITDSIVFSSGMATSTSGGYFSMSNGTLSTITTNGNILSTGFSMSNAVGAVVRLLDNFSQTSAAVFQVGSGTLDFNNVTYSLGTLVFTSTAYTLTNYGSTLTPAAVVQQANLTVGTGGLPLSTTGSYTLTSGTLTIASSYALNVGSFTSSNTNVRSIAYGAGSSINLTGSGTVWDTTTFTNFTYTGTSNVRLTNAGSTATSISSGGTAAQAQNFYVTAGTYTFTIVNGSLLNTLDFTGFSGTFAQGTNSNSLFGNLIFASTMSTSTTAGSGILSMAATSGTRTITTNGITLNTNIRFNGAGGTFQLADNFAQSSTSYFSIVNGTVDFNNVTYSLGVLEFQTGTRSYINYGTTLSAASILHTSGAVTIGTGALLTTTGSYTFTSGTLTINNSVDLTVGSFISTGSASRSLAFGTGSITTTGSGTMWNVSDSGASFTYTGTAKININNNSSVAGSVTHTLTLIPMDFNFISGTYTLSITTGSRFGNVNFTGFSGTAAFAAATIAINGNLTLSSTMATSATVGTATFGFNNTTTAQTITTNGTTVNFGISIGSAGSSTLTVRFADSFTQGATQSLTLINGILDVNSQTVNAGVFTLSGTTTRSFINGNINCASVTHTAGALTVGSTANLVCSGTYTFTAGSITINDSVALSVGAFSSTVTGTRSIAFGTGSIQVTGTGTVWNTSNLTNFSYTGTSNVRLTNSSSTATAINTGAATAAQALNFFITAGTYSLTITSGSAMNNLDFTGFSGTFAQSTNNLTLYGNLQFSSGMTGTTSTGVLTMSPGSVGTRTLASASNLATATNITLNGAGSTFQLTNAVTANNVVLTAGTLDLNNNQFSVFTFSSANSNTRVIAYGSTGSIFMYGSGTVWNTGTVTNFSFTGTSNNNLGTVAGVACTITTGSLSASQAMDFYISGAGSATVTTTTGSIFRSLSFAGFTGTYAQSSTNISVYENLVFSSGITTTTTTGVISMISTTGTRTITTNGKVLTTNIAINGLGGTFQLADNFSQTSGASFALINGTLDVNSKTTSIGIYNIVTGTRSFINGNINCATVTHTTGDLTIGTGATLVCSGTYTFTAGSITINNGVSLTVGSFSSNNTNTRSIAFGTGNITTTGSGTMWNFAGVTGFTFTGTPDVNINNNTSVAGTIGNTSTVINLNVVSGTYALTITSGSTFANLNFTGFSGSISFSTSTYTIYGNLTLSSTMTITAATAGTSTFTWNSTSGTRTILSNGKQADFGILINGVGQTVQLADAFVQGAAQAFGLTAGTFDMASYSTSVGILTLLTGTKAIANGTLNCASVTHTSGGLTIGSGYTVSTSGTYTFTAGSITINDSATLTMRAFSSSNSNARSIAFGTGSLTITGNNTTVWNTSTGTSFTSTGTPSLNFNYSGSVGTRTVTNGTTTGSWPFIFTGSDIVSVSGTFGALDVSGYSGTLSFGGATSLTGTSFTIPNTVTNGAGTGTITFNNATFTFTPSGIGTEAFSMSVPTTTTLTMGDNLNTTGALTLASGVASSAVFNMNSKTISIGILNIGSGSPTHIAPAIQNGTINCTSFVQTSPISIGSGYNIVASLSYSCNQGTLTINDGVELTVGSFTSTTTGIAKGISFGTGSMRIKGTANTTETVFNTATGTTSFTFTGSKNVIVDNTLASSAQTITINTVGHTLAQSLNFSFVSGSYILALTTLGVFGDLNFSGFAGSSSFGSNTYTIYGSLNIGSTATLTGTGGIATFTFAATSGIETITSNGRTINFGIALNGVGQTVQLADAFVHGTGHSFTLISGTFDMASYSTSIRTLFIQSGTHAIANGTLNCTAVTHTSGDISVGSGYTLTCSGTYTWTSGSITINDNATISMFAMSSNNSNVRSIAFGTSGFITITGNSTTVWLVNPAGLTYTGNSLIKLTATGTGTTTTINTGTGSFSNALKFAVTAGSYPITTASGAGFRGIDFTGYSGTWTITASINNYGDIILSPTMNFGTAASINFQSGTYDAVFTSNGRTIPHSVSLNNTGTITLTDSFNTTSTLSRSSSGTLTAAGDVRASSISLSGNTNLGSGSWYTNTSWTTGAAATIDPGTSTIYMLSDSTKTFAGAGKTYYNLVNFGAGTLIITGSNSFNDIAASVLPSTLTITSGTTQTFTNFTMSGTAGNLLTLNSSTPGSPATLSKSSGTVNVSYMSISDSSATGGATWSAPTSAGNVDGGGNTGWDFGALVAAAIGAFFAFF